MTMKNNYLVINHPLRKGNRGDWKELEKNRIPNHLPLSKGRRNKEKTEKMRSSRLQKAKPQDDTCVIK
jgi:hypothetical protein